MDAKSYALLLVPISIAVLDWIALARRWRRVGYLTKPGVILALLAWLYFTTGLQYPLVWFAAGLFLSAIGDVFLMLPRDRFIPGLGAFMLALLCYSLGFNSSGLPAINLPGIMVILLVALTSLQISRYISAGLIARGQQSLQRPMTAYMLVLTAMLISSLLTLVRPEWESSAALACSVGGLLFYVSDTLLACNRCLKPDPQGVVWRRMTYQMAQILLILGVALQFG